MTTHKHIIFGFSIFLSIASFSGNLFARNFEKRFDQTIRGRMATASNILTTCDSTDPLCAGAKAFTGWNVNPPHKFQNNAFVMVNVDADSDGSTFNSSSANLNLPANSIVLFAGLYWGGQFGDNGDTNNFTAPPNPNQRNEILFKVPGGSYQNLSGSVDDESGSFYQSFVDVTNLIAGSGDYWVANAQLTTGKHMIGGWTLVVVVQADLEPLRRVVIWDGFLRMDTNLNINLLDTLGARRDESSVAVHLVSYDGDKGNRDSLLVDGNLFFPKNLYPNVDPAPAGDIGNSTITNMGSRAENRNPFYKNTLGYDADLFEFFPYLNADANLDLEFNTPGDIIHFGVISVQSDLEDRFVQTTWGAGANGSTSTKLASEDGFKTTTGHVFHDTLAGMIHAVQFTYTYDGQRYEVTPVRRNNTDANYYALWRSPASIYPVGGCRETKFWLYREVDRSRVSWFFGANRKNFPRPLCNGNLKTRYAITGNAQLTLSDDNGEMNLNRIKTRWWGKWTDGGVIRFISREFKVDGRNITSTANINHNFYLDASNNAVNYDMANPKIWSFESDFDGRIESKIFDALIPRGYGNLDFTYSQTNGSTAVVYFRTGDSPTNVQAKNWEGPFADGDLLGSAIVNNHRYFQYAIQTSLVDPPNNTVESDIKVEEISFNLYGIALPFEKAVKGSWKRIGTFEDTLIPTKNLAPNLNAEPNFTIIENDLLVKNESELQNPESTQACSAAGSKTFPWFALLLVGLFVRRRK